MSGHDEAVDARFHRIPGEPVQAVLIKGVHVTHQYQLGGELPLAGFQAVQYPFQADTAGQRVPGGVFNDGTVRHRIGEWNAYLDDVRPGSVNALQMDPEGIHVRKTGGDEWNDGAAPLGMGLFHGFLQR